MNSTNLCPASVIPTGSATLAAIAMMSLTLNTTATDWPCWRGPNQNGLSAETGWLTEWPKDGLKTVWKAEVGSGYGTVSVSQGRLYVLGNTADQDTVYCLDALTGKTVWKHTYDCAAKDPNGYHGPRGTPTVDGDRIYSVSRKGHLFCLDAATGAVKWSKNFVTDFAGEIPKWGYAISPPVVGDWLIVEPGGAENSVVALKKDSGEVGWHAGSDPAAYSTPVVFDRKGERCLAVFTAKGLVGRLLKNGQEVFRFPWKTSYDVNAATPIVADSQIFISSGYGTGCALVDVGGDAVKEVWKNKNMRNHVNSCVLWQGYYYGFDDNELKCLDAATGAVKWSEGKYNKGSVMLAEGKLILYSNKGKLGLAEATPAGYRELAYVTALEVRSSYPGKAKNDSWAVPVLANGKMYCRSQDDLVCLDVAGK